MRNPLISLPVAAITFFLGVTSWNLFQPEPAYVVENTITAQQFDVKRNYSSLNEVVEKKINEVVEKKIEEKPFSIIEGDYYSDNQLSMYLYSFADEDEKLTINGHLKIGTKIYEIDSRHQKRLDSANAEFETGKIKGVWYKFKGKFIKKEYKDGETVLSGKLQKIIKGKVVREIESQYIFYYHKCSQ